VYTPRVMGSLGTALDPKKMFTPGYSPIATLSTYLAKAESIEEARAFCRELAHQLVERPLVFWVVGVHEVGVLVR
jgi:hypothetical protein